MAPLLTPLPPCYKTLQDFHRCHRDRSCKTEPQVMPHATLSYRRLSLTSEWFVHRRTERFVSLFPLSPSLTALTAAWSSAFFAALSATLPRWASCLRLALHFSRAAWFAFMISSICGCRTPARHAYGAHFRSSFTVFRCSSNSAHRQPPTAVSRTSAPLAIVVCDRFEGSGDTNTEGARACTWSPTSYRKA